MADDDDGFIQAFALRLVERLNSFGSFLWAKLGGFLSSNADNIAEFLIFSRFLPAPKKGDAGGSKTQEEISRSAFPPATNQGVGTKEFVNLHAPQPGS